MSENLCCCIFCFILVIASLFAGLGVEWYTPYMRTKGFVATRCMILESVSGMTSGDSNDFSGDGFGDIGSEDTCEYYKVMYEDSTRNRTLNIAYLNPDEKSIRSYGWCYSKATYCISCKLDCWFNPDRTDQVIEKKKISESDFINTLFWPILILMSPVLLLIAYLCYLCVCNFRKKCSTILQKCPPILPRPVEAVKANRLVSLKIRLALKKIDTTELNEAILEAARTGRRKCLKTLLNNGAEITAKDAEGNTLLHLAAMRGRLENVETLIKAGSSRDINCRNLKGQTAFHLAAMNGSVSCLETLAISGADPYAIDSSNRSAMWYSVSNGHYDATVFFIRSNYYLLTDDNILLPEALRKRHLKIAKALVLAGCQTGPLWGWEVFICDEEWEPEERMQLEWLRNNSENPKSLSHLSRLVIRGLMERNIPSRVKELPLPRMLQGYICMDDLLSIHTRDTILYISDRDGDIFWISDC